MFREYIPQLSDADRQERSRIIETIMQTYGCSRSTVYRELAAEGWSSGRKKRTDRGQTKVSEASLQALGALLQTGVRKNGKATLDIPTARHILEISGRRFGVSNSRLAALLKERHYDLKTQAMPSPHVRMRSLHPNHVHQVDPSMCLLYYLPQGGQKIIEDNEAYKNKPFLEGKAHLKIWRYVLTDHYSSSICVRYFQRAGESMESLWEFLLYAWGVKQDVQYAFHGVPDILVLDKGSANLGGGVLNGLKSLKVRQIPHAVGNPRAKGQVENANNLVEKLFESRLKTDPVKDVEELNERVQWWCASYNANTLQGYDSTLKRARRSRRDLWMMIQPHQLRELPREACSLLIAHSVSRKVEGDLSISFVHPKLKESNRYRVGGLEGIRPGMKVLVYPLLMSASGAVRVDWTYQGEECSAEVEPVALTEVGFWEDAPVFGQSFAGNRDTVVDKAAKTLQGWIGDESKPFAHYAGGKGLRGLRGMKRQDGGVVPLPRLGNVIDPSKGEEVKINYIEAARRLKLIMGYWDRSYLKILKDTFPEGVPEKDLDKVAEVLNGLGGCDDIENSAG